jgi:2-phospho-L-lactate guanylyltransferase
VSVVAAIPVKDLVNAKQRLTTLLDPLQRSLLARAMLQDVLAALGRSRGVEPWLVTRDAEVETIGRAHAVRVVREDENRGHTAAVAFAQRAAAAEGATVFLTVPGDVPCVTPDEIETLAAQAMTRPPSAAFAASRSGLGTNGVALAPPAVMPLTFGEPSFANHLATARAHGLVPHVLTLPGLALDVDTPDDLAALLAHDADTESRRLVRTWNLVRPAPDATLAHG